LIPGTSKYKQYFALLGTFGATAAPAIVSSPLPSVQLRWAVAECGCSANGDRSRTPAPHNSILAWILCYPSHFLLPPRVYISLLVRVRFTLVGSCGGWRSSHLPRCFGQE